MWKVYQCKLFDPCQKLAFFASLSFEATEAVDRNMQLAMALSKY